MKHKTIRADKFDMMRGNASSFQKQPEPTPVNNNRVALAKEKLQRMKADPLLERLKGIRDTTPPSSKKAHH